MNVTEFARLAERVRVMTEQGRLVSDRVEAEHAGGTFPGTAGGGLVTAEADLHARIVDIRIVRSGLTRTPVGELGRYVVEAVAIARERARNAYLRSYQAHAKELAG
jgi:DNA-binding protein YbaB